MTSFSISNLCSAFQLCETCSKVVIFAAQVGQHLSTAGWSGIQPEDAETSLTHFCLCGGVIAEQDVVTLLLSVMQNRISFLLQVF